jgi:ABC-type cobalamin/Fe3+-siderophores transport system ATPase subunit
VFSRPTNRKFKILEYAGRTRVPFRSLPKRFFQLQICYSRRKRDLSTFLENRFCYSFRMSLKLEIRNYRGIPYRKPLTFDLDEGITFIVGLNNSGKSHLLKLFHCLRPIFKVLAKEFTFHPEGNFSMRDLTEGKDSGNLKASDVVQLALFADSLLNQKSVEQVLELKITSPKIVINMKIDHEGDDPHTMVYGVSSVIRCSLRDQERLNAERLKLANIFSNFLYIPSLRTVEGGSGRHGDALLGPPLIRQFDEWATNQNLKQQHAIENLQEELRELFNYKKFKLEANPAQSSLNVTNDEGIFQLNQLGDGMSHFITVLVNALFNKPSFILIDEPENGLHPKMQETFIRALASKAQYGLITASHSIGLARSSADRIYSLHREGDGLKLSRFGTSHRPTVAESLHELGYSQFVDLGGNHILLVEGRTDIKAFREILRKFHLDQHFIIVSLGGSEFITETDVSTELGEVQRLNAKSVTVIFDSERTSAEAELSQTFKSFTRQCEGLKFLVYATDYNGTENYVTQAALDKLFPNDGYKALNPYEKGKPPWGKARNWLLFREMSKADFEKVGLGQFIRDKLVPLCDADKIA